MCAKKASRYFAFATFFLSFAPGASFGSGKRVPHTAHSRSECFSKTARQTEQVYPMSRWRLVSVHTARVSSLDCGGGASCVDQAPPSPPQAHLAPSGKGAGASS